MQRELDTWAVAERGRRGQADPLDHALSEFLAAIFPDWSERTEEDALKGSVGEAGTATMQSVAETVGLDPETASRVQILTGVRAARQTRPPSEPTSNRRRTAAFIAGAVVAAGAIAVALGIISARRGDADPVKSPPPPAEPVVARSVVPPPLEPAEKPAPPPEKAAEPAPAPPPEEVAEPPRTPAPPRKTGTTPAAPSPAKEMGTLDLNAVPWAYVSINGGPEEETPIRGRRLPAGKHKVLIRNPVLERQREMTIQISPGDTSKYVVDLRQ
jgi:hypothetical protein